MNATLSKIIDVYKAIDGHQGTQFMSLTPAQKLYLAELMVKANPDILNDIRAFISEVVTVFDQIQQTDFTSVDILGKLELAITSLGIGDGAAPEDILPGSDGDYAQTQLTVVDFADGDSFTVGPYSFAFIAADADYIDDFQIKIGATAADTATNINERLHRILSINGEMLKNIDCHIDPMDNTRVNIRSTVKGAAYNAYETTVDTSGTSAFTGLTLERGTDIQPATQSTTGRIGVTSRQGKKVFLKDQWHDLCSSLYLITPAQMLVNAVDGVQAKAELTVGTFLLNEQIHLGGVDLTAKAAEPLGPGEFLIGATPAETTTNIINMVNTLTGINFSAALKPATTDKIIFTWTTPGVVGNTNESTVTTAGTSAFTGATLTGGKDVEKGTPVVDFSDLGALPDILYIEGSTLDDIVSNPLHLQVPDDYVLESLTLYPGAQLSKIVVKDSADVSVIDLTTAITRQVTHRINPNANTLRRPGSVRVYLTGNQDPGATIVGKFNRVTI